MAHAEVGEGVDHRVLHRGGRTDRARLADALGAQGVDRCGRLHGDELEAGQLGRRDEAVVGQVRRDRVAVVVVPDLLEQGLGRALGQPAVDLALGQQRVEDAARVVDRDEPLQLHLARLGVDLDHGQVGPERERRARGRERDLGRQPAVAGLRGQLGPGAPRGGP